MSEMSDEGGFVQPRPGYEFIEAKPCRGCHQLIGWWRTYPNEKMSPHDPDGTSHFATCPDRDRFRRVMPPKGGRP